MATPQLTSINKTAKGQEFFSLPVLAGRISKLEAREKEMSGQIAGLADDVEGLLKLVQQLTDKHNQHLKFGHKDQKGKNE